MKKTHLKNSSSYEVQKKVDLNDEAAKQVAIESARTKAAIDGVKQSIAEFRAHFDSSMAGLHDEVTKFRSHFDTSMDGIRNDIKKYQLRLIGVMLAGLVLMTTVLSLLLLLKA